jgi:hypothetical protein
MVELFDITNLLKKRVQSLHINGLPRRCAGGEGGIRTPGAQRTTVFKTVAINRSATSPVGSSYEG